MLNCNIFSVQRGVQAYTPQHWISGGWGAKFDLSIQLSSGGDVSAVAIFIPSTVKKSKLSLLPMATYVLGTAEPLSDPNNYEREARESTTEPTGTKINYECDDDDYDQGQDCDSNSDCDSNWDYDDAYDYDDYD